MGRKKLNKKCSIEGCGRKHAANGYCLMHYKRVKKHGSPEYRWGGKIVGRSCIYCDRTAEVHEMCMRHYQMWNLHGDALYADKKIPGGIPYVGSKKRGYKLVVPDAAEFTKASPQTNATIERSDRPFTKVMKLNHGFRDGSHPRRRQWEHRKITNAKKGQIVHHIDLNSGNNDIGNLHVFNNAAGHAKAHRSLEKVAASLVHSGFVVFDRLIGEYQLSESFLQSNEPLE